MHELTGDRELDFRQRNRGGHSAEAKIAWGLLRAGWLVQWVNVGARYDILAWGANQLERIEVKNEDAYAGSGNLCIETHQGNPPRPSGILTSESTIMVHTLGDMAGIYRTQAMRNFLAEKNYKSRPFVGADNQNAGMLVKIVEVEHERWYDSCPIQDVPHSPVLLFRERT